MKINALIIGCGRIGAMCDFEDHPLHANTNSYSHAKSLYNLGKHNLYFYDQDYSRAEIVANKYKGIALKDLNSCEIKYWDWISIASPTQTHLRMYQKYAGNSKLILLEKPIAYSHEDCDELLKVWKSSGQRTYVNYMRNFLSPYKMLKNEIAKLEAVEPFSEVRITYHRGLINNFSHALSLISFLFGQIIKIENPTIFSSKVFNENLEDPTISFNFFYNNKQFLVFGLDEKQYPILDIEFFSKSHVVRISNSGNLIQIFSKTTFDIYGIKLNESYRQDNVLDDFMGKVVRTLSDQKEKISENVEESFLINMELLNLCQNLQ